MKTTLVKITAAAAFIAASGLASTSQAQVAISAPLTPVTAVVGGAAIIAGHEAFARKPYGRNGEIKKACTGVVKAVLGKKKRC
ncbi:hypothetical protein [Hyphomicrobium sp. CS1BSMeth3]|uniref:hypothetical protein n=1 Tax=Hyphomicrobium sp. CS1BSMeth3 TaxID=1892844 RepID=UPI00093190EA|nr:hypothetical protein [Hyphomicrobium sp. CS1BSMeth3]